MKYTANMRFEYNMTKLEQNNLYCGRYSKRSHFIKNKTGAANCRDSITCLTDVRVWSPWEISRLWMLVRPNLLNLKKSSNITSVRFKGYYVKVTPSSETRFNLIWSDKSHFPPRQRMDTGISQIRHYFVIFAEWFTNDGLSTKLGISVCLLDTFYPLWL